MIKDKDDIDCKEVCFLEKLDDDKNFNKEIKKLIDKYGFIEDIELGKIPIMSNDMTEREVTLVKKYIEKLIEGVSHGR